MPSQPFGVSSYFGTIVFSDLIQNNNGIVREKECLLNVKYCGPEKIRKLFRGVEWQQEKEIKLGCDIKVRSVEVNGANIIDTYF